MRQGGYSPIDPRLCPGRRKPRVQQRSIGFFTLVVVHLADVAMRFRCRRRGGATGGVVWAVRPSTSSWTSSARGSASVIGASEAEPSSSASRLRRPRLRRPRSDEDAGERDRERWEVSVARASRCAWRREVLPGLVASGWSLLFCEVPVLLRMGPFLVPRVPRSLRGVSLSPAGARCSLSVPVDEQSRSLRPRPRPPP